MTNDERIKKEIMDRLKARPHFRVYCLLCEEYCTTVSEMREMVHYDCWVEWKKSRQNPPDSSES